jgi:hypothetical protein
MFGFKINKNKISYDTDRIVNFVIMKNILETGINNDTDVNVQGIVNLLIMKNILETGINNDTYVNVQGIINDFNVNEEYKNVLFSINNDAIADYLLKNDVSYSKYIVINPNNKIVDLGFNVDLCPIGYSLNTNDKIVEYLISNPDKIVWETFSINSNDKAVNYCLENKDKVFWHLFSLNSNDKAVDSCLLDNINKINIEYFKQNPNPKAKEYCSRLL